MKQNLISGLFLGIALILNFSPARALAWGSTGHRVIGEIAEGKLKPQAKRCLRTLMGEESLAHASTWADEVRSDPDKEKYNPFLPWHYIEIPDGKTLETTSPAPVGNALTAMKAEESVLRSKTASRLEKQESLKLLVHFLGDIHQPLHVGNGVDRGANDCFVNYFGSPVNLHALWDEGLIDHSKLSFTEYARFLLQSEGVKEEKNWVKGEYADWIKDSFSIRDDLYPKVLKQSARGPRPYCKKEVKDVIPSEAIPNLGYEYNYQTQSTLDRQLLKAGVRIGATLNRIFFDRKCGAKN